MQEHDVLLSCAELGISRRHSHNFSSKLVLKSGDHVGLLLGIRKRSPNSAELEPDHDRRHYTGTLLSTISDNTYS